MADHQHEFRPGDAVRDKDTGRAMTVAEVYWPTFRYRYRRIWRQDGQEHSELLQAHRIEPADG